MSLLLLEGFDDGLMIARGWLQSITLATGRNGNSYGANAAGSGSPGLLSDRLLFAPAMEMDEIIFQCAFKFNGLMNPYTQAGSAFGWIGLGSDAASLNHFNITPTSSNQLLVRRAGTTLATITGGYVSGQWHYLECRVKLHATLGTVRIRIDGVEKVNLTGQNTKNGGTKTVFDCFMMGTLSGSGRWEIDDLVFMSTAGTKNNDFIGDAAIETLFPNNNGDVTNGVGSDGNSTDNYLLIDDTTPSFTDYVNLAAVGDKDLYQIQNPTRRSGVVHGVEVSAYMVNTDSGARGAGTIVKSGATTTSPADKALGTAAILDRKVMDLNPDTSAPWDISSVDALQVGFQVAS